MSSQVFYRRWRPQTLADIIGQAQVTQTLLNALRSGHISHAYLFCGPWGTGKTSAGRILAKAVNCLNNGQGEPCNACALCQAITEGTALDVIEVDAASNRGIDEIRNLREKVIFASNQARYKVYIIDEVHMLTKEASNALLKTLEEPPPHIIFILATTEAHKVLPTILSRCQRFDFRRISQADVVTKLTSICQAEGIKIEPESLRLIARATIGSLRDAENLLEQLTTYYSAKIEIQQVQSVLGITDDWRARELVSNIINNDVSAGVATINNVNRDGLDLRQFNRELVEYLRVLLLLKTDSADTVDLSVEEIKELKDLATKATLPQILKAVKLFGQLKLGLDNYSTLPLELALVDCTLPSAEEKPIVKVEPEIAPPMKKASPPTSPPPIEKTITEPEVTNEPAASLLMTQEAPAAKRKPVSTSKPPVAEPTPASAPAAGSEIKHLQQNWRQIIKEAPPGISRTPAAALLRSAEPSAIEENTVILSFKYPLHKENMEKPDNQQIAEQIISRFLERSCRVRCIYKPEDNHLVEEALKIGAQKIIEAEEK
ncbi:MAG: DNA polymerase III subunit gamma/tau [Dehalococcoidales bacterium]|nr:DNA polymerase III subunit gamma/tau [Dehalococcoidales bacterium]